MKLMDQIPSTETAPKSKPAAVPVLQRTILPLPTVILAAGRGRRLMPLTQQLPKCLIEIGGEPLLMHLLRALKKAGVRRVEIIIGFGAEQVVAMYERVPLFAEGGEILFTHHPEWRTGDELAGLGLSSIADGDAAGMLVCQADVLLAPELLPRLLMASKGNTLLAELEGVLGEEEAKLQLDGEGRIVAAGAALDPSLSQAAFAGMAKFGAIATEHLLIAARNAELRELLGLRTLCDAVHQLRAELDFYVAAVAGEPWIEIDYHHDLARARHKVWPAIMSKLAGEKKSVFGA